MADGSVLYLDVQGIMQTHEFGRGVVLHVRRGIMSIDFAPYVMRQGEQQIASAGRYVLMVDACETKMHTTEFREAMTEWFVRHEQACVHMLIRSKMLEMALNVANLALGAPRAKTYFDAALWAEIGRREAPSFARRPLVLPKDVEPKGT
jgi:hypothetical protein